MSDIIVALHDLTKSFDEGGKRSRIVLDALDNSFERGQFVVILGSSGSGKSTLLNLISGIEEPTSGHVTIYGNNITAMSDKDRTLFRRKHVGFIFQFFNLIPTLTVQENITLPSELAGQRGQDVAHVAQRLLNWVGLADRADSFPDKLSGGEQQRVAICRALAHDPHLILADEPTGNLDEETGETVLNMLLDLTRSSGKTMLMATHNPEIVPLADRVFRVHNSKLVETYPELEGFWELDEQG